jgi:Domain of unknown function (DU1801)
MASKTSKKASKATKSEKPSRSQVRTAAEPVLLAGGNPQIPKGEGDGPVQAYIAAMQGWKRDVGRRLDALIVHTVPGVHKAVKWNSPFYGVEGEGWANTCEAFAVAFLATAMDVVRLALDQYLDGPRPAPSLTR